MSVSVVGGITTIVIFHVLDLVVFLIIDVLLVVVFDVLFMVVLNIAVVVMAFVVLDLFTVVFGVVPGVVRCLLAHDSSLFMTVMGFVLGSSLVGPSRCSLLRLFFLVGDHFLLDLFLVHESSEAATAPLITRVDPR